MIFTVQQKLIHVHNLLALTIIISKIYYHNYISTIILAHAGLSKRHMLRMCIINLRHV